MVSAAWRAFAEECARWRDLGRPVEFWWRDDDASHPLPPLVRLLALAEAAEVPLALAAVPEAADAALLGGLSARVCVLQHGADHLNRAAAGEKKTEFPGTEPVQAALDRLRRAGSRLAAFGGARCIGVLVPPWNRLSEHLIAHLPKAGFRGLSRYGARTAAHAVPGLPQTNTHVDLVAWQAGRGFVGEEAALALATWHLAQLRQGAADSHEATGWLTHHACHDEPAWRFLELLFERSRRMPGVQWVAAREIFSDRAAA